MSSNPTKPSCISCRTRARRPDALFLHAPGPVHIFAQQRTALDSGRRRRGGEKAKHPPALSCRVKAPPLVIPARMILITAAAARVRLARAARLERAEGRGRPVALVRVVRDQKATGSPLGDAPMIRRPPRLDSRPLQPGRMNASGASLRPTETQAQARARARSNIKRCRTASSRAKSASSLSSSRDRTSLAGRAPSKATAALKSTFRA